MYPEHFEIEFGCNFLRAPLDIIACRVLCLRILSGEKIIFDDPVLKHDVLRVAQCQYCGGARFKKYSKPHKRGGVTLEEFVRFCYRQPQLRVEFKFNSAYPTEFFEYCKYHWRRLKPWQEVNNG